MNVYQAQAQHGVIWGFHGRELCVNCGVERDVTYAIAHDVWGCNTCEQVTTGVDAYRAQQLAATNSPSPSSSGDHDSNHDEDTIEPPTEKETHAP